MTICDLYTKISVDEEKESSEEKWPGVQGQDGTKENEEYADHHQVLQEQLLQV